MVLCALCWVFAVGTLWLLVFVSLLWLVIVILLYAGLLCFVF